MRTYCKIAILFFLQILSFTTNAQTTAPKDKDNKIEIKPYFSTITSKAVSQNDNQEIREFLYDKMPNYGVDALYVFNKFWASGIYFGYSMKTLSIYDFHSADTGNTIEMKKTGSSLFYGIKSELQLLPLLDKNKKFRFNIYVPIQLGLVSQQITNLSSDTKSWDKPLLEFGAGLGFSYNFTKYLGLFGEYQLGEFYNARKTKWKVGLSVTF